MAMIVERYSLLAPKILGIFRILAGIMFCCYGAQKILGAFGGMPPGVTMTAQIWTAGIIELVGGALIAVGLFTRPAAFLSSGLMAFAYFMGHAGQGSFWPNVNQGDKAILYCWLFLYLSARGPGAFALDNLWGRNREAR
ncbi:MAG TPA: DoxX family protein [Thermoanaerobaculia bacterium]|jgi:putative oxidoreductase